MLSLVLIAIVISNVILWSYQMNEFDLERMQEKVDVSNVTRVTRSSWSTPTSDYTITAGSKISGNYTLTKTLDSVGERFREENSQVFNLNNDFKMDLNAYPLSYIRGIEILIRYNTTVDSEKWFLRAFNWSSSDFEVLDIQGNQPIANQWNDYAVNVTNQWGDYVNSAGTIRLEFADQGNGTDQATIEIDFQGVRVMIDSTSLRLKNSGQYSAHIVAIWIIDSSNHQRYSASLFINSGEEIEYLRVDLNLPEDNFTTRVVTERGNIAVFP